ncbi:hypothetical protein BSL78_01875 [Apostichopus japonicus]|uniref:Uncharacterized protein n=1 Tax=Stichopus japonicus TaxID=307972 RepID=A0A2G8LLZ6_STIJA|nr:hypothetical protein BSL78_01875 [Apostichopus japonicus]
MLGKPAKLGFVYEFVGEKSQKWKTNSMLTKLVMVARSEIDMAAEMSKKLVSVGTNTSPVKEAATTQLFRNPSQEIKIAYKADSSTPILTQNGQLTLRLNPGTTVDHMGQEKMKDFQFARPLAPAPIPVINTRLTNSTLATTDGGTVNLNTAPILYQRAVSEEDQLQLLEGFWFPHPFHPRPPRSSSRSSTNRCTRVTSAAPDHPNNRIIGKLVKAVPTVTISKSGVHDSSDMCKYHPSPPMRSDVGPSNTVVNSTQKTLVNNNNHDVIGLAPSQVTAQTLPLRPNRSSPPNQQSQHQLTYTKTLRLRSLLTLDDLSGMSTPKASREGGLDRSLLNTPVIQDKHSSPTSTALNISPPNLSSLLDISLPSVEGTGSSQDGLLSGFRERLQELSVAAALSTTTVSVPKGGGQSPFKIGGGSQWLHEESSQNTEISLGSLLDQLEMTPEKKSTLSIPPPVVLADGSRDSVMSRDIFLVLISSNPRWMPIFKQCLTRTVWTMWPSLPTWPLISLQQVQKKVIQQQEYYKQSNQWPDEIPSIDIRSKDYLAKFADLAAHIAAKGWEEADAIQEYYRHSKHRPDEIHLLTLDQRTVWPSLPIGRSCHCNRFREEGDETTGVLQTEQTPAR